MALQKAREYNTITVVGGGTSGYVTTFFLCATYPDKQITWVYPEENNTIGVGEAIVPYVSNFLAANGITIKDIIRECKGSLKLGIKFKDFKEKGHEFVFPFGKDAEESAKIQKIIEHNKIPDDIFDYEDISNHFDVNDLMIYMDSVFESFDNLKIRRETVVLADLKDEMVIDCTGFSRNIIKDAMPIDSNFYDISNIIPNNEALVYRVDYTDRENQLKPYSTFTGMKNGWSWQIPMKHKIGIGYCYPKGADVVEEFTDYLSNYFGRQVNADELNKVPMKTGRNDEHIIEMNNQTVVSIGLSSFFIEPIESTGLYLVVRAVEILKKYLDTDITAGMFNSEFNNEFDTVLDFIIAHYKYSNRKEEYWESYKNTPAKLYRENNLFPSEAWTFVLGGFGVYTEGYDDLVNNDDLISNKELVKLLSGTPYQEWIADETNFK